jgi:hypothetical protein
MNTQPMQQSLQQLPQHVKQALNQATQHTTSFSESFGKLFARGDLGERRFHGLVGSVIRDLSSVQGGAQGAASALATLFERLSVGTGPGAVLLGIGIIMQRLVARGEELRKMASDTAKELQQMGHALKLATAGESFGALAEKSREAHKEVRKLADEAAKEAEHSERRLQARRLAYEFRHPFATESEVRGATEKESAEVAEKLAKAKEIEAKYNELAVQSAEKSAEIAKAQLSGSIGQVEALKLQLEYVQKIAEVEQLTKRDPQRGAQAKQALDEEFAARRKLNEEQAAQSRREFQAQAIQGQFAREQAEIKADLSRPGQAEALAGVRVEAAKAEVKAAQDEVAAAETRGEKEQQIAALRLQSAQTKQIESQTEMRLVAAQEEQKRREFQSQMIAGQYSQQQAQIQGRMVDIQNSALSTNEKQVAIARERVALAESVVQAAQAEVRAAQDQVEAAKSLGEEEQRIAALRLQSAQTRETQARTAGREAAGGVAEQRATQLEAAGREEEMSPQEKWAQYFQRIKQYEGLKAAAAREREGSSRLIEPPKYGEAEYDPLKRYKAAAAQEEIEKHNLAQREATTRKQVELKGQQDFITASGKTFPTAVSNFDKAVDRLLKGGGPEKPPPPGQPKPGEPQQPAPQQPGQPTSQQPQAGPQAAQEMGKFEAQATQQGQPPEAIQRAASADRYVQQQMGEQYPGVDQGKAAELQQGIEREQAYWNRPDVQAAQAGQQAIGEEARAGAGEDYGKREQYEFGQQQQDQAAADRQQQADFEGARTDANVEARQTQRDQAYDQQQLQRRQQSEFEQRTTPEALQEPPPEATLPQEQEPPQPPPEAIQEQQAVKPVPSPSIGLDFNGRPIGKIPIGLGGRSNAAQDAAQAEAMKRAAEKRAAEKKPEAERGEGEDWQEKAGKVLENLPPELVGITGPAAIGVEAFKQLANPPRLEAGELTPKQKVELHKRQGTKEDDPEYAKAREQMAQEEKAAAFTKEKGLPLPEFVQKHREQEQAAEEASAQRAAQPNAALEIVKRMQAGKTAAEAIRPIPQPQLPEKPPQPPQPQVTPEMQQQPPPLTPEQQIQQQQQPPPIQPVPQPEAPEQKQEKGVASVGGKEDKGIVNAIKEAITQVMDKYWR